MTDRVEMYLVFERKTKRFSIYKEHLEAGASAEDAAGAAVLYLPKRRAEQLGNPGVLEIPFVSGD